MAQSVTLSAAALAQRRASLKGERCRLRLLCPHDAATLRRTRFLDDVTIAASVWTFRRRDREHGRSLDHQRRWLL
jgi:hypothetical protein